MRVSLTITNYSYETRSAPLAQHLTDLGHAADAAGIDTVWVADHLLQMDPNNHVDEPMLEAFSTLAYLAHATARVRLGTMVAAATFRAPALLVKSVTSVDLLSNGRARLGIGAGYQQKEASAMGLDLPSVEERFARLEETLQIAEKMFNDDAAPHRGTHYRLDEPINHPLPISRPRIPILVGGAGERRTLRLVARYADGCNLFDIPDEGRTIQRKLEVLQRHCEELGRDYGRLEKTVSTRWAPDTSIAELANHIDTLAGYGATHAVLLRSEPWTAGEVARLSALTGERLS